ncbi:MAG: type I secretion C-terminal target domain-containing protein [Mesorhizobium sp.]|nr:MAG: type I secretion C-terminal target domain-containing protein [Mesorhizobium sp.]
MTVDDDMPVAANDGQTATEGGAPIVATAANGVLANDHVGADQPGTVTAVTGGTVGSPIVTAYGTLTLNGDGSYTYTPKASVPDGTVDSFTYTVKDADGDTSQAVLSFTFSGDNNHATAGVSAALVDEDDLATGNHDTATGDNTPSAQPGTLTHNYGADGAGHIELVSGSETVNGVSYTYTANAAGTQIIASAGGVNVFQVDLTDAVAGTYTVTLLSAIQHPTAGTEDNLNFSLSYKVYDADDTAATAATGNLTVTVDDDMPVVSANNAVQLDDDALAGGNAGGIGDDSDSTNATGVLAHSYGADGSGSTLLTATGIVLPSGFTAAVTNGGQTLTISQGATAVLQIQLTDTTSGAYTVTQLHAIDHPAGQDENNLAFTVNYVTTDHDGDTATGSLSINIDDDTPTISNIQDAIMPNVGNTDAHGTWSPSFGADGPSAASAISIALNTTTVGSTTYTSTDTGTNVDGHELYNVTVTNGSSSYSFYEYSAYDPSTKTATMYAFADAAHTSAFFELAVKADGTYDFHLDTNTLQTSTSSTFDFVHSLPNGGQGDYLKIVNGAGSFGSGANPSTGFDVLIDGMSQNNPAYDAGTMHKNNPGLGVDDGNLDTGDTVTFLFGQTQSDVTIGVAKANNTYEKVTVEIWNADHTQHATETIIQLDGTPIVVNASTWTGTGQNAFFDFQELWVTNTGVSKSDQDPKIVLTTLEFNHVTTTTVSDTSLNFSLGITDHDGDTYTSSDNLSVALQGTHTAPGYQLSGTNDVFAASANGHDTFTGNGTNDTVDFSNASGSVQVYLDGSHSNAGAATGDTLTGIENLIGSSHDNDILVGNANSNILIAGTGNNTQMTGGGGADTFVINAATWTSGGSIHDLITDYHSGEGDTVDLSKVLDAVFGGSQTLADTSNVTATKDASGNIHIDVTHGGSPVEVATLAVNPGITDTIKIIYDDAHHTTNVTAVP